MSSNFSFDLDVEVFPVVAPVEDPANAETAPTVDEKAVAVTRTCPNGATATVASRR